MGESAYGVTKSADSQSGRPSASMVGVRVTVLYQGAPSFGFGDDQRLRTALNRLGCIPMTLAPYLSAKAGDSPLAICCARWVANQGTNPIRTTLSSDGHAASSLVAMSWMWAL